MSAPLVPDGDLVRAVARRWWAQDPEAWREEGHDFPHDLENDVRQVLRCYFEELAGKALDPDPVPAPPPVLQPDSERMRRRVVHGWAFRKLAPEVERAVEAYLKDGNPGHLSGTNYQVLRDGMYNRGER